MIDHFVWQVELELEDRQQCQTANVIAAVFKIRFNRQILLVVTVTCLFDKGLQVTDETLEEMALSRRSGNLDCKLPVS